MIGSSNAFSIFHFSFVIRGFAICFEGQGCTLNNEKMTNEK